VFQDIIKTVNI